MVKKKKKTVKQTKCAFGVGVSRFLGLGFHPGLDPAGVYKHKHDIGPGTYNLNGKTIGKRNKDWYTAQLDSEFFAKTTANRFPKLLVQKRLEQEEGCPGDYESRRSIGTKSLSCKANLDFGRAARFKQSKIDITPGPGSYGKNHIPSTRYDEAYVPRKMFTKLPPFEWDGFVARLKTPTSGLAPNRYCPIDRNAVSVRLLNKVVSKRGPYDMFTGPRDETTMKNYFAPSTFKGSKTFLRSFPSTIDRLKDPLKANNGKLSNTERWGCRPCSRMMIHDLALCYKDPNAPGPTHYDVQFKSTISTKKNKYAFNMSVEDPRFEFKRPMMPGPGRYEQRIVKKSVRPHQSWPFLSKVQRGDPPPVQYNSF